MSAQKQIWKDKSFLLFVAKFLLLFALFYLGTLAIIGLAAPGGWYSPWVERYLDYVSWIKQSLLWGSGKLLGWLGYPTVIRPDYVLRIEIDKPGVKIAMDCVGYGVYSFWAAYILANSGKLMQKLIWIAGGIVMLWGINVGRISLLLLSNYHNRPMPLGIDHHTWFNFVAYMAIFACIGWYEKQKDKDLKNKPSPSEQADDGGGPSTS